MAVITSIGMWIGFIIITIAFLAVIAGVAYYGLKLIDYLEQWYLNDTNKKDNEHE